MEPTLENGYVVPNILKTSIDMEDFEAKFKGETEILESLDLVAGHLKTYIKDEISKIFLDRFMHNITGELKNYLIRVDPTLIHVYENIYFNRSLTNNVVVKNGYLSLPYDGYIQHGKGTPKSK